MQFGNIFPIYLSSSTVLPCQRLRPPLHSRLPSPDFSGFFQRGSPRSPSGVPVGAVGHWLRSVFLSTGLIQVHLLLCTSVLIFIPTVLLSMPLFEITFGHQFFNILLRQSNWKISIICVLLTFHVSHP